MRKYLFYILILIVSTVIFSPVIQVHADAYSDCVSAEGGASCAGLSGSPYQLLAPLPCPPGATSCTGTNAKGNSVLDTFNPTDPNALSGYLNLIIKLVIGISAVLAVVMIVIGGVQYMTSELISSKEAGKERIMDAIFGLLIALGAWALLNTINPNLLNSNVNIQSASVSVTLANDNVPQTPIVVNGVATYKVGTNTLAYGTNLQTDFPQATYPALVNGISVCSSLNGCGQAAQCTSVGEPGCTSTLGLNANIVNSIETGCTSTNNGTPCPITITGGTEFWNHNAGTDHQPGSSDVDLSATAQLNSYLTGGVNSSFPAGNVVTDTKNSTCYYAEPAGDTPATSGQHWHVYPLPSSGQC